MLKRSVVEIFLEFLAGTEEGEALGADFHTVAGARVAASIGAVFLHLEAAETADLNTVAFKKSVLHAVHEGIDHEGGFIERNIGLLCEVFDQFTLIHDFSDILVSPPLGTTG
jgi:hypothetical protein